MKKFWWSVFFGALFGILLLFPETNFSYRFFNLAHTLQLSVVQIIGLLALNTSILAGIFGALWGAIAQPYLSERAKNLATKHDVSAITREVEQVKLGMSKQLEDHKTGNQLRMAVVEKRFQAHQEAYAHWFAVMRACLGEGDKEAISQSQEWWIHNCLYLDTEPRFALRQANHWAKHHIDLLKRSASDDEIKRNAKNLEETGQIIENAVGLPPIVDPVEFFDNFVDIQIEPGTGVRIKYREE